MLHHHKVSAFSSKKQSYESMNAWQFVNEKHNRHQFLMFLSSSKLFVILSLEVFHWEKICTASRKCITLERISNINIFPYRSYRSSARFFFSFIRSTEKDFSLQLSFASTVDSFAGPLDNSRNCANCSWSI